MTLKTSILNVYTFNLTYAHQLMVDIPESRLAEQPHGVPNHPAWVIGHLAKTCDFAAFLLGMEPKSPPEWQALFGNGSTPVADLNKYPDKKTLLQALEDGHKRIGEAFSNASDEKLTEPTPHEGFRKRFATVGDAMAFVMTSHEATHLGQLSAWRRAAGLKSVF